MNWEAVTYRLKKCIGEILNDRCIDPVSDKNIFYAYQVHTFFKHRYYNCGFDTFINLINELGFTVTKLPNADPEWGSKVIDFGSYTAEIIDEVLLRIESPRPYVESAPDAVSEPTTNIRDGYIYLIQEREFIKTNEDVYKIGKTRQKGISRFKQYPKGSDLLYHRACCNCDIIECKIIQVFKTKYIQKREYGIEYFEGNYESMCDDINEIIKSS